MNHSTERRQHSIFYQYAAELKSEIPSSKFQTNQNTQIEKSKSKTLLFGILCLLIIWICFEFRISIFRFVILFILASFASLRESFLLSQTCFSAERINSQIRRGDAGMVRQRTPRGFNASLMALSITAGVASTAFSPAPLTPMGEKGEGVSV